MQEDKATAKRVAEEEAAAAAFTAAAVAAAALDAINAAAIAAAGSIAADVDADADADIPHDAASGIGSSSAISTVIEDRLAVSFEPAATDVLHASSSGSRSAALDCTPALVSHSDHTADAILFTHGALLSPVRIQEKEKDGAVSLDDVIS
jgi:hypothetical protein